VATRKISISVTIILSLTHFLSFALHRFTVLYPRKGNNDGEGANPARERVALARAMKLTSRMW
jgi:hypothetical protein